jgi:hypothetical protein
MDNFWYIQSFVSVFVWLLLWVFLCANFFLGLGVAWFFVLGCGLGFVGLLLWLWE